MLKPKLFSEIIKKKKKRYVYSDTGRNWEQEEKGTTEDEMTG